MKSELSALLRSTPSMRRSFLLAVALAITGCRGCFGGGGDIDGPTLPEPKVLTETEPNDRPDQALALTEDADVTAALTVTPSRPDEDWYQLDPGGAGPRVDLRVVPAPGADVSIELYDAFRNRLVVVNSAGVGEPERMPNLYLTGRRFVRVTSSKRGSGGTYTLHVRFTPAEPGEEEEPNDGAETANAIPAGTPVVGLLGHAGDEDWYRFELRAPDARLEGDGALPDPGAPGLASEGTELAPGAPPDEDAPLPRRDEETAGPDARAPDTWSDTDAASPPGAPSYGTESGPTIPPDADPDSQGSALPGASPQAPARDRLWGRLDAERLGTGETEEEDVSDPAPHGTEGFGAASDAPSLPGDPSSSLRNTPAQSRDDDPVPETAEPADPMEAAWRAATAALLGQAPPPLPSAPPPPPSVAMRIELTGIEEVAQEVRVLSEDLSVRFETTTRPGEGLNLRNIGVNPKDRFVYVVVRPGWSGTGKEARRAYSASQPYTLTLSLEEGGANAELEPNDAPDEATPLSPQVFREGFLSQPNDVDYFVLDAPTPVLADFQVTGVEDVDLALVLVERTETGTRPLVEARDGDVGDPEQLNAVRCHGQCLVRVESAMRRVDGKRVKGYSNPDVPYRISVSTIPDDGGHETEPNNKPKDATPITLGKPMRGTIHPVKDVDLYRLDLSERAVRTPIRVHLSGLLKVDLALYLHRLEGDGGMTLVQSADSADGDAPERLSYSAEPGVWILEVRDTRNRSANPQDRYQLTVQEGG